MLCSNVLRGQKKQCGTIRIEMGGGVQEELKKDVLTARCIVLLVRDER